MKNMDYDIDLLIVKQLQEALAQSIAREIFFKDIK